MLDMWVGALQSRGVATVEERKDSRNSTDPTDVDSDSESAMLTAVTEVSDSDEDSKSEDDDSKSESSDKIDGSSGTKK